jgi:hypothetical protein
MILIASRASKHSLYYQMVREKIWVCMTETHPIQQSSVEYAGGAFQNTSLQPDE